MNENHDMETRSGEDRQDQAAERTFTQAEVEEIIQRRLSRDRRNRPADAGVQAKEKELNARELKLAAKERLLAEGMPLSLADVLKYEDEDTLNEAITVIKKLNPGKPGNGADQEVAPAGAWGQRISGGIRDTENDRIRKAMGLNR